MSDNEKGQNCGEYLDILISHIEEDGLTFWAQMASNEVLDKLDQIEIELEKLQPTCRSLGENEVPMVGKIYFCSFEDGRLYRCKVVKETRKNDKTMYIVQYIDYGNSESKLAPEIFCLEDDSYLNTIPPFSNKYILHHLKVDKENALKVQEFILENYSEDSTKAKLCSDLTDNPTKVVLFDKDMINVNKLLVTKELATKITQSQTVPTAVVKKFYESDLKGTGDKKRSLGSAGSVVPAEVNGHNFNNPLLESDSDSENEPLQLKQEVVHNHIPKTPPKLSASSSSEDLPNKHNLSTERDRVRKIKSHRNQSIHNRQAGNSRYRQSSCGHCSRITEEMKMQNLEITKLRLDNQYCEQKIRELQAHAKLPELISRLTSGEANVRDKKEMVEFLNLEPDSLKPKKLKHGKEKENDIVKEAFEYVKKNYSKLLKLFGICQQANELDTEYRNELLKIKQGFTQKTKHSSAERSGIKANMVERKNYLLQQFYLKTHEVMEVENKLNNNVKGDNIQATKVSFEDLSKEFAKQAHSRKQWNNSCENIPSELQKLSEKIHELSLKTLNLDVRENLHGCVELLNDSVNKLKSENKEYDLDENLYIFLKQLKTKLEKLISDIEQLRQQQSNLADFINMYMPEITSMCSSENSS